MGFYNERDTSNEYSTNDDTADFSLFVPSLRPRFDASRPLFLPCVCNIRRFRNTSGLSLGSSRGFVTRRSLAEAVGCSPLKKKTAFD